MSTDPETPDSFEAQIYQARLACGKKLQCSYVDLLEMFNCVLTKTVSVSHPYDLEEPQLEDFDERTKIFSLGGIGNKAKLSTTEYAYRLVSKKHLPNYVKFKWPRLNNKQDFFWDFFWTASNEGEDWLQLKDYAYDTYPSDAARRWFSITWWTDFTLFTDIVSGAYTIGMFSEWVKDEVVLLRTKISSIKSLDIAHVPTVVDAFMQPVFQPVSESPPPETGITINLSEYKNPSQGVSEFVFPPFSVNLIEFKPISIDVTSRGKHPLISKDDPDVLNSLLSYYGSL